MLHALRMSRTLCGRKANNVMHCVPLCVCRFQPPEKFAPFLFGPGLCYNNALENAASAMEVAAVAAKNCALLVQQHVQQQVAKLNQPTIAVV